MTDWTNAQLLASLSSLTSKSAIISTVLDLMPYACLNGGCGVYLFESDALHLYSVGVSDRAVSDYLRDRTTKDPILERIAQTCVPAHEGLVFAGDDWHRHALYETVAAPNEFEHYMLAPLVSRTGLVGALALARTEHLPSFLDGDMAVMASMASCVSVALTCVSELLTVSPSCLTPRELQIATYVAKGCSNAEIAAYMCISVNTVKKYLKELFVKAGVSSRAELAWMVASSRWA